MEKWVAVIGSPRKGKNTELLVDYIIEGLSERNIIVDKFLLDSSSVSTCKGCERCISTGICIIKDEISEIIGRMKVADGYIFASPSYNYNITSQMKALLDRAFCLNDYSNGFRSRLSPGKKAIVVGVCKGATQESIGYTVEAMSRPLSELGVKIIDEIEYYDTKNTPVGSNDSIKQDITQRIRMYTEL